MLIYLSRKEICESVGVRQLPQKYLKYMHAWYFGQHSKLPICWLLWVSSACQFSYCGIQLQLQQVALDCNQSTASKNNDIYMIKANATCIYLIILELLADGIYVEDIKRTMSYWFNVSLNAHTLKRNQPIPPKKGVKLYLWQRFLADQLQGALSGNLNPALLLSSSKITKPARRCSCHFLNDMVLSFLSAIFNHSIHTGHHGGIFSRHSSFFEMPSQLWLRKIHMSDVSTEDRCKNAGSLFRMSAMCDPLVQLRILYLTIRKKFGPQNEIFFMRGPHVSQGMECNSSNIICGYKGDLSFSSRWIHLIFIPNGQSLRLLRIRKIFCVNSAKPLVPGY